MEPLAVTRADLADLDELATVAAQTFPLACPPSVTPENIASFVEANLSLARFTEYLADPQCVILIARRDDRIVGYAMLVGAELSKMYVLPEHHGTEAAAALMAATIERSHGNLWLGVNQKNQRAQRFYAKHGFTVTGTRTFQVGARREHDYVMTREL